MSDSKKTLAEVYGKTVQVQVGEFRSSARDVPFKLDASGAVYATTMLPEERFELASGDLEYFISEYLSYLSHEERLRLLKETGDRLAFVPKEE